MHVIDRGYAIVGTPRSGTTHLCALLTSTGVLGRPAEYLHPDHAAGVRGPDAAVPGDAWASIRALSRTGNGVFAIKAFRAHLARFAAERIHREVLALPLVFVTRDDKLGQAISLVRAMQTRQWRSNQAATRDHAYDAVAIRNCLDNILVSETAFRQTIALHGLPALHLSYNRVVEEPLAAVRAVGALVGVDGIEGPLASPLAVQRDAVSAAWRARFVAEQGPPCEIPAFRLNDRWSRLGHTLRRVKRRLPFTVNYPDHFD